MPKELTESNDELCGKIKFIFQPTEEGGGGARGFVARGILDDVDYLFSGHIGLSQLDGQPVMSHQLIAGAKDFLDTRRFNIDFIGKAAHPCGDPQNGKNALLAACQASIGIHSIAPTAEGLLYVNVGVLQAGTSRNTIAPGAHMEAEVRGTNDRAAEYGERKFLAALKGAAAMYEVECEIDCIGHTYSGSADDRAIGIVMECVKQIPWFEDVMGRWWNCSVRLCVMWLGNETLISFIIHERGMKESPYPLEIFSSGYGLL